MLSLHFVWNSFLWKKATITFLTPGLRKKTIYGQHSEWQKSGDLLCYEISCFIPLCVSRDVQRGQCIFEVAFFIKILLEVFLNFINIALWEKKSCKLMIYSCNKITKVHSSYDPLAYFSNIFISGKNVVFSVLHIFPIFSFLAKMKTSEKYTSGP